MVRPTNFEIKQSVEGAKVTLSLQGELDMHTLGQLSHRVAERLAAGAKDLTIDLRALEFMDSSGLRLLIELHDSSRADAWALKLVCPEQETAALVLRATGADKVLPFVPAAEA
jgi:anti-sigma B factor antagonist